MEKTFYKDAWTIVTKIAAAIFTNIVCVYLSMQCERCHICLTYLDYDLLHLWQ